MDDNAVRQMNPEEIEKRVMGGERPDFLPELSTQARGLVTLVEVCWAQELTSRPSFSDIKRALERQME